MKVGNDIGIDGLVVINLASLDEVIGASATGHLVSTDTSGNRVSTSTTDNRVGRSTTGQVVIGCTTSDIPTSGGELADINSLDYPDHSARCGKVA